MALRVDFELPGHPPQTLVLDDNPEGADDSKKVSIETSKLWASNTRVSHYFFPSIFRHTHAHATQLTILDWSGLVFVGQEMVVGSIAIPSGSIVVGIQGIISPAFNIQSYSAIWARSRGVLDENTVCYGGQQPVLTHQTFQHHATASMSLVRLYFLFPDILLAIRCTYNIFNHSSVFTPKFCLQNCPL
jgi:hypothetical protein